MPGDERDALVGSVGDAYDNAMAESVFATPAKELLKHRRHWSIGHLSANNFERRLTVKNGVRI